MVITDYICMAEGGEDGEFTLELTAFLEGHAGVGYFLSAKDNAGGGTADLADYAERTVA